MLPRRLLLACLVFVSPLTVADSAEVKVLTAGAMKQVVLALQPEFESRATSSSSTTTPPARLQKRIEGGEAFDLAVITPAVLDQLAAKDKIAPATKTNLARVAIGVMVRPGATLPDISTVEAFKNALLEAKWSPISIPHPAARAASIWTSCSRRWALRTRSTRRRS